MTGPPYSLSRKEGWRRYVDAPARQRPEPLAAGQLAALGGKAREEYDEARHDWHASPKLRGRRARISCLTRHASLPAPFPCSQENLGVSRDIMPARC